MAKKIILGIFLAFFILGTVLGASGSYYFWQQKEQEKKKVEEKEEKIKDLENKVKKLETKEKEEKKELKDIYEGWLTYTNKEVGYELKYPQGWKIEERSGLNEFTGNEVKYITIRTPDQKYFLFLGLKKINQNFDITDRTGVGAGEVKIVGEITVLQTPVKVKELVLEGKVQEYFYESDSEGVMVLTSVAGGRADMLASFGKDYSLAGAIDMANLPEEKIAEQILQSLKLIN